MWTALKDCVYRAVSGPVSSVSLTFAFAVAGNRTHLLVLAVGTATSLLSARSRLHRGVIVFHLSLESVN